MKPWDQFLPDILPHCQGCPDLAAEDEARNAAEEFFAKSFTWRVWIGGITTVADQTDYTPLLPTGTRMVKLHEATLAGEPLEINTTAAGETGSTYKASTDLSVITLGPDAPAADLTLGVRVSVTVKNTATGLADDLFDRFRLDIANGAIARLCSTSDRPYSSPDKAASFRGEFLAAIEDAKGSKEFGNSSARKRVAAHFF
jgi:hypothetical protein